MELARATPDLVTADPEEREDPAGENISADESFENATPVPLHREHSAPVAGPEDRSGASPPPAIEALVEKIPPRTRALLGELFKAEITAVRRLNREQLR